MKYILFVAVAVAAAVLQSFFTTIPLVLISILILYVVFRSVGLYIIAFLSGILIDIFSVQKVGFSSAFLVSFLFTVILYERKFEIDTIFFILFATFLGSFGTSILFSYQNPILYSVVSAFIAGVVFAFLSLFRKKAENRYSKELI